MADAKPPRLAGSERSTVGALLQYQRNSFVRKLSGVREEDARSSPVGSGTSLLWLANHIADAEVVWLLHRFSGRRGEPDDSEHAATVDEALARYEGVRAEVDGLVAASDLDQLCPPFDDRPPVNLRWILAHLLEETARHAGHADILREMIDGSTGR